MIKENQNLKDALERYIYLLNHQRFFDAHEVLEEVWHPLRKANHPLQNLIKGLINASIAFEHIKRNRVESHRKATTVLASYTRHKPLCTKNIEHYKLFSTAITKIEFLKLIYLKT
ncbi:MAG: DUF309 domain-containing protein [Sulfurovaceae bacterium]|nr:DUF309 domain-containing protein [Sulfurovaceae bacterium]